MIGMRAITDAEYERLKSILPTRDACILTLGIRTGFRISELLSLNLIDVYREGNVVEYVRLDKNRLKGKQRSRAVPIHPEAKECLEKYIHTINWMHARIKTLHPENIPLFFTKNWHRMDRSNYWMNLKKAVQSTGESTERIGTHSMRKAFAKKFYQASGDDLFKLQHALDHSHIGTTVKYLQVNMEEINELIKKLK